MYGHHKKDWAKARQTRRRRYRYSGDDEDPIESPFLKIVHSGNLAAVEWLLSDTPSRLYKEFCAANKDNKEVAAMARASGGFEKAIDDWLNRDRKYTSFPSLPQIVFMLTIRK